jgi:hypothetical protein
VARSRCCRWRAAPSVGRVSDAQAPIESAPYFDDPYSWSSDNLFKPHETFPGITSPRCARDGSAPPLSRDGWIDDLYFVNK